MIIKLLNCACYLISVVQATISFSKKYIVTYLLSRCHAMSHAAPPSYIYISGKITTQQAV